MATWHVLVVKMRFVTLLPTKVLNKRKIVMVAEKMVAEYYLCYGPAAYPKCRHQNIIAISCTIGVHAPVVIPKAHPSLLPEHQFVRKSYLHSACGPRLSN